MSQRWSGFSRGHVGLQMCTLSKDVMKLVLPPAVFSLRGVWPGDWSSAAGVSQPSAKIRVRGGQAAMCPGIVLIMKRLTPAELFIPPGCTAYGCLAVSLHPVFLSETGRGIACHQSVRPGEALLCLLFWTQGSLSREAKAALEQHLAGQPNRNLHTSNPFLPSLLLCCLWLTDYQDISASWVSVHSKWDPRWSRGCTEGPSLVGGVCLLSLGQDFNLASLVAQMVKNLPAIQIWFLGWEDPLEKMGTHLSILAGGIPWTEEPGGLQSMGSKRVSHDWTTFIHSSLARKGRLNKSSNLVKLVIRAV